MYVKKQWKQQRIPNVACTCSDNGQNPHNDYSYIDSPQSYNLSVSEAQPQSEKSVHAYCSQY